jgi:protein ImuB
MYAVLHLADFALQAVLRTTDGANRDNLPAALLDPTQRPPVITACTAAARQEGVACGQTSSQALARSPQLRLLVPRPDAEREAGAALLATAFAICPAVEATAPGVCTLQIDGVPPERREPALSEALARLVVLGLHATGGAGPTPLLALYAARHTDALLIIRQERAFLAPLPLAAADPEPEMAALLARWGLRTLGDLTALPKAALAQRLGPPGVALWERAAGETSRPLQLVVPPPVFTAALTCEFALETLEPLLFLLRRFVDRLALELATAAFAAAELQLTLALADETTLAHTLRLPEPSTDADTLFRTLHTHLESLRTASAIVGIQLSITPTRGTLRQRGLFDRALRDPHLFTETLARIAAVVGADRVGTPVRRDTHRPDAFALAPPATEIPPTRPPAVHPAQGLVLRRYRPPRPVQVELSAPPAARPAWVRTDGGGSVVHAAHGPWRSSGDWWQNDRLWQREEWDVELDGLYRLVRTPEGWFLEGEYD